MTGHRQEQPDKSAGAQPIVRLLLRLAGVGLLWATAGLHLDLYLTGYRTIPTIGPLFLFQVIAALLLGLLILVTGNRLLALAGAGYAVATLGGYLLSVQFGLFGFREIRTTAGIVAAVIEVAAFIVLVVYATQGGLGWARLPSVSQQQAGVLTAVVAVVAFGLLGGALAGAPSASGGTSGPVASGTELRTAQIGGVKVLTNASGRTLYWFAPDTSTKSACYGSCAGYWPPVGGPLRAGPGVTGTLSTIHRTGGATQETYNGHPLYTYIGDSGPGQAHGNNVNLNGGLWHEVVVTG
jgi:predicted lipoprotein with Yx(FWY)xxD motif